MFGSNKLPWSEEESKLDFSSNAKGYDGELTSMTFKHVVGSDCFNNSRQRIKREHDQMIEELQEARIQEKAQRI